MTGTYVNPFDELFPVRPENKDITERANRAAVQARYARLVGESLHRALTESEPNPGLDKLQMQIRDYEGSYPFLVEFEQTETGANAAALEGQVMSTLYNGTPAKYEPENCPKRGKLVSWAWDNLDGRHGGAQTLYCPLCGVAVERSPYPEEMRRHPE